MIHGAHLLLYSSNPEADRAFFRDVLRFEHVDAGDGWLIFALPPAELAVHPAPPAQPGAGLAAATVYLMCDNLRDTLDALTAQGVPHTEIQEARWGTISSIRLPGGAHLGLYEPRHPLAISLK
ncbi:MAG TPA: VOC family protein [Terracidiphilus sp.]|jgi:catechol 2,3-dioxygenase-like lactoylglutathione lyase family enzyme